jgi:hypothetical protein
MLETIGACLGWGAAALAAVWMAAEAGYGLQLWWEDRQARRELAEPDAAGGGQARGGRLAPGG